jgi:hypothetical protein
MMPPRLRNTDFKVSVCVMLLHLSKLECVNSKTAPTFICLLEGLSVGNGAVFYFHAPLALPTALLRIAEPHSLYEKEVFATKVIYLSPLLGSYGHCSAPTDLHDL